MSAAVAALLVEERPAEIVTSVGEFLDWVTELATAAGIVKGQADAVVPTMTFDEACLVLDVCRDSVRDVESTADGLSARIADLWAEGRKAVLDVEGVLVDVPVDVKHRKDPRHWDHVGLMRAVIGRRLELAAAEGRVPDPFEVGSWLIGDDSAATLPSYWRQQQLAELGIDVETFCRRRDQIPAVELRKPATAADATTEDDSTRRATPARRDTSEGDHA